ncbi:hypothetical protein [Streptomyces longispororuber]|uniref:hypothetical protein n=1 Tax=Streptomyces longispororuber TaxID=68230 RepID=UPI0036FC72E6
MTSTARHLGPSGDSVTPAVAALQAVASPPPAIRELERILDVFRTVNRRDKAVVSDARLQQLEWVAGELALALPLGLTETAGDSLAELLASDAVHAYLLYGRGGHLRSAPIVSTDPSSYDTSERIRIFCLEAFARQAQIPFETPELPGWGLRPTVSPHLADLITKYLEDEAEQWPETDRSDSIVRGLAMWGVMRDVLPRLGEIESMLLDDLDLSGRTPTLSLIRQPQGGLRGKMPEPETAVLSPDTAARLEQWILRRSKLIDLDRFQGSVPRTLWVAVHLTPGIPLHRRGISKWYKKVADAVQEKQEADGVLEEDLVPTRWETMRRTLLAQQQASKTP